MGNPDTGKARDCGAASGAGAARGLRPGNAIAWVMAAAISTAPWPPSRRGHWRSASASSCRISRRSTPQDFDIPMDLIVTEAGLRRAYQPMAQRPISATDSSATSCLPRVSGPSPNRHGDTKGGKDSADHHRDGKSRMPVDREIGDDRRRQAAEDGALVIDRNRPPSRAPRSEIVRRDRPGTAYACRRRQRCPAT